MAYRVTLQRDMFLDVLRTPDNRATMLQPLKVWENLNTYYKDGDTLPSGKKVGDLKREGDGWVKEEVNFTNVLNAVFGEADEGVLAEIEKHFTDDVKTAYFNRCKNG